MNRAAFKRRIFWARLLATLSAPLRYLERRRQARWDHELALKRLEIEASNKPIQLLSEVMKQTAVQQARIVESSARTTDVLKAWLDGFKVTSEPSTQTMTAAMEDLEDRELDDFLNRNGSNRDWAPERPQDITAYLNAKYNSGPATKLAPPIGPEFLPEFNGLPFEDND